MMRSEQEMLTLIVATAREDERIRAVIMNGSRVNPKAPPDIFQDFDIVYIVNDVASFTSHKDWINRFGKIMIAQMPEAMQAPSPSKDGRFVYLMQFMDGNRIDLTLYPLSALSTFKRDSLSILLLDKDGVIDPFEAPSEKDYLPTKPTQPSFSDCCNEFWWVCTYVAKGLWREEITYAKFMLDQVVRAQLMKMLTWHIGVKTQYSVNPGTQGKYFKTYLEPELWKLLEATYSDASYDTTWEALFTMCALFRRVALPIAQHYHFNYPDGDDQRVMAHLNHVRALPKDASAIY